MNLHLESTLAAASDVQIDDVRWIGWVLQLGSLVWITQTFLLLCIACLLIQFGT